MRIGILLFPLLFFMLMGCEKKGEMTGVEPPVDSIEFGDYKSDREHNLNIVYFIPSDLDTVPGFEKRLSECLLWAKNWYKEEMTRNGYPGKTFGLLVNDQQRIKITTIFSSQPKANATAGIIANEVNSYFALHPEDETSEHTLILLPPYDYKEDGTPINGPFHGWDRWCFAMDCEPMDMQYQGLPGTPGNQQTLWFGGMVHELGHAFNLPHSKQKVSETIPLGKALMYLGNYTLGKEKTMLTGADAAILNTTQIFNTDDKQYYGGVNASFKQVYAHFDTQKQALIVSGRFESDVKVNNVVYYNDPNVNNNENPGYDYNAITWDSPIVGTDSFYVEMKNSDLEYFDGSPYELRIKLVHENGRVTQNVYNYQFVNNVPDLSLGTPKPEFDKTNWLVTYFSSQQNTTSESAMKVLDNDPGTFWHSRWSTNPATYPHELVIDMGQSKLASGLSYTHRAGAYRSVKDIEILYSNDGMSFTSLGNYIVPKNSGAQYLDFTAPINFRYFKVVCKSSHDGTGNAAIAELGIY